MGFKVDGSSLELCCNSIGLFSKNHNMLEHYGHFYTCTAALSCHKHENIELHARTQSSDAVQNVRFYVGS